MRQGAGRPGAGPRNGGWRGVDVDLEDLLGSMFGGRGGPSAAGPVPGADTQAGSRSGSGRLPRRPAPGDAAGPRRPPPPLRREHPGRGRRRAADSASPARATPASPAARPGDLYLVVQLAPHPRFRIQGRDVVLDLPVAAWEAALGAPVPLDTPGGPVRVDVPPGTSSGRRLRLRGRGLPNPRGNPGDLYAEVKIMVPPKLTEPERRLFQELGEASHSTRGTSDRTGRARRAVPPPIAYRAAVIGTDGDPPARLWHRWSTQRWFASVLIAMVVLVLAGTAVGAAILAHTAAVSNRLSDRISPARTAVVELTAALVDQETGVRGYLLSGDERFLEPYTRGVADERTLLAGIRQLLAGEPVALADLARVEEQARDWRTTVADPLDRDRRRGGGPAAAADAVQSRQGGVRRGPGPDRRPSTSTSTPSGSRPARTSKGPAGCATACSSAWSGSCCCSSPRSRCCCAWWCWSRSTG